MSGLPGKPRSKTWKKCRNWIFIALAAGATGLSALALGVLLVTIARQGHSHLSGIDGERLDVLKEHFSDSPRVGVATLIGAGILIAAAVILWWRRRAARHRTRPLFRAIFISAAAVALLLVIGPIVSPHVMPYWRASELHDFLTSPPSRHAEQAGIGPALMGSIWICLVCAVVALPLGVGTAIFLEEFRPRNRTVKKLHGFIQLNITNLAGVPSIVYGIIGLTAFVQMWDVFGNPNDPGWTVGQKWYHMYYLETGRAVFVPVDGRDAEPEPARSTLSFQTDDGAPIRVEVLPEEEIEPIRAAVGEQVDAFENFIEDRIEAGGTWSSGQVSQVMEQAFAGTGLQVDPAKVGPEVTRRLLELNGLEGRLFRRGMREVTKTVESAELRLRLPNVLVEGAMPHAFHRESWHFFQIPFGRSVFTGGLTLMLVVLPIVIISAQEALRAVPDSLRQGALACGATQWQMISTMTLPTAVPGIMTGSILAMSRAIGEAAPILIIAGIVYIRFTPEHLMDGFTAMPLQIYNWAGLPQKEFHIVAAAGIIVLLAVLLTFNALAIVIRQKFQKPLQ